MDISKIVNAPTGAKLLAIIEQMQSKAIDMTLDGEYLPYKQCHEYIDHMKRRISNQDLKLCLPKRAGVSITIEQAPD